MDQHFKAENLEAGFIEWGTKTTRFHIDGEEIYFTWHHLDDYDPITNKCTMQLVLTKVHNSIEGEPVEGMAHSGAVAQYKTFNGKGY